MRKLLVSAMIIVVLVFVFYSASLFSPKPRNAEAIIIIDFWQYSDIYCDGCRGHWYDCCSEICYNNYARGQKTEDYAVWGPKYRDCMDNCSYHLARYCNLFL